MERKKSSENSREEILYFLQMFFFIVLFGYLNYLIIRPFLTPLIWAAVFSILFYPVYIFVLKYVKRASASSLLVVLVILLTIVGPVAYITFLFVNEILSLADAIARGELNFQTVADNPIVSYGLNKMETLLNMTRAEVFSRISAGFSRLGKEAAVRVTSGIGNLLGIVFDFVMMAIAIFFFLKDGPKVFRAFLKNVIYPEGAKQRVVKQVKDIVVSTVYGGVVVAMLQGSLAGFAFYVVGASSPVLWGFTTFIACFIPALGAFVVWFPAALYFFVKGAVSKGVLMTVMGIFISTTDNFLRPLIVGKRAQMSFFPLLISVLGGVHLFGLLGVVLGPVLFAVFLSVLKAFREGDGREAET